MQHGRNPYPVPARRPGGGPIQEGWRQVGTKSVKAGPRNLSYKRNDGPCFGLPRHKGWQTGANENLDETGGGIWLLLSSPPQGNMCRGRLETKEGDKASQALDRGQPHPSVDRLTPIIASGSQQGADSPWRRGTECVRQKRRRPQYGRKYRCVGVTEQWEKRPNKNGNRSRHAFSAAMSASDMNRRHVITREEERLLKPLTKGLRRNLT